MKNIRKISLIIIMLFIMNISEGALGTIVVQAYDNINNAIEEGYKIESLEKEQLTPIMGKGGLTRTQLVKALKARNKTKTLKEIIDFVDFTIEEANIEGINYDYMFSQMMLETNYLNFGLDVKIEQNNFGGIGATGGGNPGASFSTVQIGVRAVVQHLKAYASKEPLVQECVDPRFNYVKRGSAEYVEYLGMKENPNGAGWAASPGYGNNILRIYSEISNISNETNYSTIDSFKVEGDLVAGSTLKIEATATPSSESLYKIFVCDRSTGTWTTLSDWSDRNKISYTVKNPGRYTFVVHSKYMTSNTSEQDDYKSIDVNVKERSITSIKSLDVTGEGTVNKPITIKTSAEPQNDVLYRIWVCDRSTDNWQIISDWSSRNTIEYLPTKQGRYTVVVHTKNKYKPGDIQDDYKAVDVNVKQLQSKVNSLSVTGDQYVGSKLTMSATATPEADTLYRLWVCDRSTNEWKIISDWSTKKSIEYTPTKPGLYRFTVHVKHKTKSGDEQDDYRAVDVNVKQLQSKVNSLSVTGDQYVGSKLTMSATATPEADTLYRLWVCDRSTNEWKIISDWSTKKSIEYTPTKPGLYRFTVHVKHKTKSGDEQDDYRAVDVNVKQLQSKVNSLSVTGDQYVGSKLTMSATATPEADTLYRLWVCDRSTNEWKIISDWSTKKSIEYTPTKPGLYRFTVHVKHKTKSGDEQDDYRAVDVNVKQLQSKVNSLSVTGDQYVGSKLTMSATATPEADTLYRLWVCDRSTNEWKIISDWSTKKSIEYTPTKPGLYRFTVHVKHKTKSGDEQDDYRAVDVNVKQVQSKVSSFEVIGEEKVGSTINIKASGNPINDTLYKFWVCDRKTNQWIVLKDYSKDNTASYKITEPGRYSFVVHVKNAFSNKEEQDDYASKDMMILNRKIIVVDPGHGGSDPGTSAKDGSGRSEKQGALALSIKLNALLRDYGYSVVNTRTTDIYVGLKDRSMLSNNIGADFFVSLHYNSFEKPTANGIEVFASSNPMDDDVVKDVIASGNQNPNNNLKERYSKSSKIAAEMSSKIAKDINLFNRGGKDNNLYVCRNSIAPSVLVEGGFLSNPSEASYVLRSDIQDKTAKAIAEVISKYI